MAFKTRYSMEQAHALFENPTATHSGKQWFVVLNVTLLPIAKRKPMVFVMLCKPLDIRVGQYLIDEKGRRFQVIGFPFICRRLDTPEWLLQTAEIQVDAAAIEEIGHFLRPENKEECK